MNVVVQTCHWERAHKSFKRAGTVTVAQLKTLIVDSNYPKAGHDASKMEIYQPNLNMLV